MILIFHIIIALTSIAYTTYLYFFPSLSKLHISYALVAATFGSGFYLVVANPSHIVQTCVTGIVYLGVVGAGIFAARHKLLVNENEFPQK